MPASLNRDAQLNHAVEPGPIRGSCPVTTNSRLCVPADGRIPHRGRRGPDPQALLHRQCHSRAMAVAMAARPGSQHAEAVLGIMEGDALDRTGQDLPIRRSRLSAGAGLHDVPSAGAVGTSFTGPNCRPRTAAALPSAKSRSSSSTTAPSCRRRPVGAKCAVISSGVHMPRTEFGEPSESQSERAPISSPSGTEGGGPYVPVT